MNRAARVTSLDALDQFRAALAKFGHTAGEALGNIRSDVQGFCQWLEHDQVAYWKHEIRKRDERLAEAKNDLHRCLASTIDAYQLPSCIQEKKAVRIAKERLELAEERLAAVRHWIPIVQQAAIEYLAHAEPTASAVTGGVPRAMAALDRIRMRLDEYLALAPPSSAQPPASGTDAATAPLPNRSSPASTAPASAAAPATTDATAGAEAATTPNAAVDPAKPKSDMPSEATGNTKANDAR